MCSSLSRFLVIVLLIGSVVTGFQTAVGQAQQQQPLPQWQPQVVTPPGQDQQPTAPPAAQPFPPPAPQTPPAQVPPAQIPPAQIPAQQQMFSIPQQAPRQFVEEPVGPSVVETVLPAPAPGGETMAVLKTSVGEIQIRLFTAQAPITTKSFMDLARGTKEFIDVKTGKKVKRPFYNGLIFHRVIKNFLVQTGCPYGTGRGGPGETTKNEFSPVLRFNKPGIVAMAPPRNERGELQKDANGSQFFITLSPRPELDDKATIFGEVIKGLDIVEKISQVPTGPTDRPIKRIYLLSIELL